MRINFIDFRPLFVMGVLVSAPVLVFAQFSDPTPTPDSGGGVIVETPPAEPIPESSPAPVEGSAAVSPTPVATPRPMPATATPAPSVMGTPVGSSVPSVTSAPSTSSAPSVETLIDNVIPAQTAPANSFNLVVIVATAFLAVLGVLGFKFVKNKGQKGEGPDLRSESRILDREADRDRCDSIKELIEQKKKELADMVKNWPEDKLKEMAQNKVLGELSKDEDIKKVIDTAQDIQSKYNKLNETIEMLQKRYDLCVLSIPSIDKASYKGTIVENSLNDKAILENLKIIKTKQSEDWMLHDVSVNEEQIAKLGEYLSEGPWYMNFWKEDKDDGYIVFKDKSFNIKYSDKNTWTDAINYGKSKGIPEEQLDFKIES